MTEAKLFRLPQKDAFNTLRQDVLDHVGLLIFAFGPQSHFQLLVVVKMIFNGALVATGDKDQGINTCRNGFSKRRTGSMVCPRWAVALWAWLWWNAKIVYQNQRQGKLLCEASAFGASLF